MEHAFDVSEAFEEVHRGPPKTLKADKDGEKTKHTGGNAGSSFSKAGNKVDNYLRGSRKAKKPPPGPCPLPRCKGKNRLHGMA